MATTQRIRRCTVHRSRGQVVELPGELEEVEREMPYRAPVADRVAVREIMSRDLVCAQMDLEISAVVNLIGGRVGCLPVVDERRHPIGIITKSDLVEQLDAAMRFADAGSALPSDLLALTADDVMMPMALTVNEQATIAYACAMMMNENTHHVLVISNDGTLVGVVSAKDIVQWVTKHNVLAVRRDASCGPPEWHPLEG